MQTLAIIMMIMNNSYSDMITSIPMMMTASTVIGSIMTIAVEMILIKMIIIIMIVMICVII